MGGVSRGWLGRGEQSGEDEEGCGVVSEGYDRRKGEDGNQLGIGGEGTEDGEEREVKGGQRKTRRGVWGG